MQRLVEDLLEFSRVNNEKTNKTDVNVQELVQTVLKEINLSIQEKKGKHRYRTPAGKNLCRPDPNAAVVSKPYCQCHKI